MDVFAESFAHYIALYCVHKRILHHSFRTAVLLIYQKHSRCILTEYTGVAESRFGRVVSHDGSKWHGLLTDLKKSKLGYFLTVKAAHKEK